MIHLLYIVCTVYGRRGTNGIPWEGAGKRERMRDCVTLVSCGDNRRKDPDTLQHRMSLRHPFIIGSLGMNVRSFV